ncbi:MAG TPA: tRNA (adenosine(37)-N6)-dimethylallyltransferase MiaA [candidate division Zixibacteria bacterium]|nr:tRNA (adenosine(37)-N6)-dimethylallyltransferase MiaA [candidate division Zixibacteria bacterium]
MIPETTPEILALTGPTGAGKSAVAHELARRYPLRIINADSRQIISGFDIGSAKPSAAEQREFDYRLIDVIDPGERFSAFHFQELAEREIRAARREGRIPVICGGTGLYLRALSEGIFEIEDSDPDLRDRLERQAADLGPEEFHALLRRVDPLEAELIHPHNVVRVTRALEIYHLTGKSKSELAHSQRLVERPFRFLQLALTPPISEVYERINQRVDAMLESGWLAEVERLIERHGAETVLRAKTIGYTELTQFLAGEVAWEAAVERIKRETRRFAKRQMTWLRHSSASRFCPTAEEYRAAGEEFLERAAEIVG